jgi:hypothetical protein
MLLLLRQRGRRPPGDRRSAFQALPASKAQQQQQQREIDARRFPASPRLGAHLLEVQRCAIRVRVRDSLGAAITGLVGQGGGRTREERAGGLVP